MHPPIVTALYAGLLGLILLAIAYKAGSLRGKLGISIGDGGNQDLQLAMRRQANFIEYVPVILILIAVLEMDGVSKYAIHGLGAVLAVARVCHAIGMQANTMKGVGRFVGASLTALVLLVASVWAIVIFFLHAA